MRTGVRWPVIMGEVVVKGMGEVVIVVETTWVKWW